MPSLLKYANSVYLNTDFNVATQLWGDFRLWHLLITDFFKFTYIKCKIRVYQRKFSVTVKTSQNGGTQIKSDRLARGD
jgi:hypothetical protein